ncbi:MAG: ABC transporter ATP-binding protein [Infirmifilum sp.]|jgi:ABC-type lipoprotein export system ATPase subunit|uniref:ABC transporter ATP-binding protein n=1 Tax=Infirmifilum sp. TaxID=2856575 RepID=UPI0023566CA4
MSVVARLEGVWKAYGNAVVLRGVSLEVKRGDFIVIKGRSGSGKTTLLSIMGLLRRPDKGNVYIMGVDASVLPEEKTSRLRLKWIGIIPQFLDLLPTLTVYENVELSLIISGESRRKREEKVERILRALDLWKYKERFPEELSGGERQKVAVARAIVNSPALILADEPTAHLDDESAEDIYGMLRDLSRGLGAAVVVSTTELSEKLPYAREYWLRSGLLWPAQA